MSSTEPLATLYVILGSHACRTGMLMLEHKGVPYRTVQAPTGLQRVVVRRAGFPGTTVPALRVNGRRVQTNREIARFLDELQPSPSLFPGDPDHRRRVEEMERWGDETFQMVARRLAVAGMPPGRDELRSTATDGRLGPILWRHAASRRLGGRLLGRYFKVNPETERELLDALPGMLGRIDACIDSGDLNGDELNAADFMIATSLALLCYRPDLRPEIEARPCGELLERVLPESGRRTPDGDPREHAAAPAGSEA